MTKNNTITLKYKGHSMTVTITELEQYLEYSQNKMKDQQHWISVLLKQIKKWKSRYRNEKEKNQQVMR